MRLFLVVGLAASLLLLAACGGELQSSGVRGIVLLSGGPMTFESPSPLPDGFGTTTSTQGRPYPYPSVEVKKAGTMTAVAVVKPDAKALFSVKLPPGTYVLKALVPKNSGYPKPTTVVVTAGQYARAVVYVASFG